MAQIPIQVGSVPGANVTPPLTLSQAAAAGGILTVTDTTAAPTSPITEIVAAAVADQVLGTQVTGDTQQRYILSSSGAQRLGTGAAATDVTLGRQGIGLWGPQVGSLDVSAVGQGLRVAEGTNAKQGTGTLVAGTLTVANTAVTANSRIFLTGQLLGGTAGGLNVTSRVAGTSFTVTSTNAADTSTFAYEIFEPG